MFKGNSKPQEKNLGLYKAPYRRNQLSNFEEKKTVFGIISLQENVTHMEQIQEPGKYTPLLFNARFK